MEIESDIKDQEFLSLDTALEILGNSTRRVILSKLAKVPHSTSELAASLGLSRQAVHSQLKLLSDYNLIEEIDSNSGSKKYRIKSNLSIRIDISPDYFNIMYNSEEVDDQTKKIQLKDEDFSIEYQELEDPNEKLRFLAKQLKEIEDKTLSLENQRSELVIMKECLIKEIKNIMENQYKNKLLKVIKGRRNRIKHIRESLNLGEEIFFTFFFNPEKYFKRINIDNLLDDLFFSDMDNDLRARNRVSVEPLLRDLSNFLDFLRKDEDDWFFDI